MVTKHYKPNHQIQGKKVFPPITEIKKGYQTKREINGENSGAENEKPISFQKLKKKNAETESNCM